MSCSFCAKSEESIRTKVEIAVKSDVSERGYGGVDRLSGVDTKEYVV